MKLHLVYLAIAVPAIVASCFLVPPGRVPDEGNHLLRAAQLADGEWLGIRQNGIVGGHVDTQLEAFAALIGKGLNAGWSTADSIPAKKLRWSASKALAFFPNTVRSIPVIYLPASFALLLGKQLDLSIWHSFMCARLFNGLAAAAVVAWAIALSMRGKALLTAVLLLPMAVFQMGSVSQDALIIALSALLAAVLTRQDTLNKRDFAITAACVFVLATARPPLIALGCVLVLPMWRRRGIGWRQQAAVSALCLGLFAIWFVFIMQLQVAMHADAPASAGQQVAYLLGDPARLPRLLWHSVSRGARFWLREFVGQLGWLNVGLPNYVHRLAIWLLSGTALVCMAERGRAPAASDRLGIFFTASITVVLMLLGNYLSWTPVGADEVSGTQGRYFYSVVVLLPLILPHLPLKGAASAFANTGAILTVALAGCASIILVGSSMALDASYARDSAGDQADNWRLTRDAIQRGPLASQK